MGPAQSIRRLVAAALCAVAASGWAQFQPEWNTRQTVVLSSPTPGGVMGNPLLGPAGLIPGRDFMPRSVNGSVPATGGEIVVRDTVSGPGPRGPLPVKALRTVSAAAVGRAIARSLPAVGTAVAVAELLDEIRCRERMGGGAECDEGVPESPHQDVLWEVQANNITTRHSTHLEALSAGLSRSPKPGARIICPAGDPYPVSTTSGGVVSAWGQSQAFTVNIGQACGQFPFNQVSVVAQRVSSTVVRCPSITVNGLPFIPTVGVDGKCPTQVYQPRTEEQVGERVRQFTPTARLPAVLGELDGASVPVPSGIPYIEGPSSVDGGRITRPDGSVEVRDHPITYSPPTSLIPGYSWEDRTVVYPPGVTPPAPGEPPPVGSPPATVAPPEFKGCGLPGGPPCKIDEGGTPPPPPADALGGGLDGEVGKLRAIIDNPPVADLSWSWSLQLPTACGPIQTPAFAPWIESVDLCQFQPVIHDLMSVLWVGVTLWFCVGMVFRTLSGS